MATGGYAWWYVDALSDDGRHGLTIIGFIGSVFSPYYAWARRRAAPGKAEPLNHNALNVALYGRSGHRWAMTERGSAAIERRQELLRIGPSRMQWRRGELTVDLDEITAPWPSRIRGQVRLHATAACTLDVPLDTHGQHRWSPIAPIARVEVDLVQPALRWQGAGYFDCNQGSAALEDDFSSWTWSRAALSAGRTMITYDVQRRFDAPLALAYLIGPDGSAQAIAPPPQALLPRGAWGITRPARGDAARLLASFEDGPFYTRSAVAARLLGEDVAAVHESLSLDRFRQPWVQSLLPFRMPRRR